MTQHCEGVRVPPLTILVPVVEAKFNPVIRRSHGVLKGRQGKTESVVQDPRSLIVDIYMDLVKDFMFQVGDGPVRSIDLRLNGALTILTLT